MNTDMKTIIGVAVPGARPGSISIQANDEKEYHVIDGVDPKQAGSLLRKRVRVFGKVSRGREGYFIDVITLDEIPVDPGLMVSRPFEEHGEEDPE